MAPLTLYWRFLTYTPLHNYAHKGDIMFEVSESTIIAVLNYLGKRPYVEVAELIVKLSQLKQVEQKPVTPEQES
jgi:hypothetical protein